MPNSRRSSFAQAIYSQHTMALNTPIKTASGRSTYTPTSPPSNTSASPAVVSVPPELDQTLGTLTSHRSVLGYLLIARGGSSSASIIRNSGVVFEGEKGRKYAGVIAKIVESVQAGLEEINSMSGVEDPSETDEVRFMRIRTKRHEIMISPDERYLLAVLHDPTVT